jgi:hypothetical protein
MKINCSGCKQLVDVPDLPPPEVLNTVSTSLVVVHHAKQGFCLTCKIPVYIHLQGANLQLVAVPVPKPQQQPIILAPGMPGLKNGKR